MTEKSPTTDASNQSPPVQSNRIMPRSEGFSSKKYSLLTFINGMVIPSASENVAMKRKMGMNDLADMLIPNQG